MKALKFLWKPYSEKVKFHLVLWSVIVISIPITPIKDKNNLEKTMWILAFQILTKQVSFYVLPFLLERFKA